MGAESKPTLSQPLLFPPPKPSKGRCLEGSSGVQRLGVGDSQSSRCWAKVLYQQSCFYGAWKPKGDLSGPMREEAGSLRV